MDGSTTRFNSKSYFCTLCILKLCPSRPTLLLFSDEDVLFFLVPSLILESSFIIIIFFFFIVVVVVVVVICICIRIISEKHYGLYKKIYIFESFHNYVYKSNSMNIGLINISCQTFLFRERESERERTMNKNKIKRYRKLIRDKDIHMRKRKKKLYHIPPLKRDACTKPKKAPNALDTGEFVSAP